MQPLIHPMNIHSGCCCIIVEEVLVNEPANRGLDCGWLGTDPTQEPTQESSVHTPMHTMAFLAGSIYTACCCLQGHLALLLPVLQQLAADNAQLTISKTPQPKEPLSDSTAGSTGSTGSATQMLCCHQCTLLAEYTNDAVVELAVAGSNSSTGSQDVCIGSAASLPASAATGLPDEQLTGTEPPAAASAVVDIHAGNAASTAGSITSRAGRDNSRPSSLTCKARKTVRKLVGSMQGLWNRLHRNRNSKNSIKGSDSGSSKSSSGHSRTGSNAGSDGGSNSSVSCSEWTCRHRSSSDHSSSGYSSTGSDCDVASGKSATSSQWSCHSSTGGSNSSGCKCNDGDSLDACSCSVQVPVTPKYRRFAREQQQKPESEWLLKITYWAE